MAVSNLIIIQHTLHLKVSMQIRVDYLASLSLIGIDVRSMIMIISYIGLRSTMWWLGFWNNIAHLHPANNSLTRGISSKLCTRLFVTKMAEKIWITSDPRIIIGLGRHNNNICLFKSGSLNFAAFTWTGNFQILYEWNNKKAYTINQSASQCTAILQCLSTTFPW